MINDGVTSHPDSVSNIRIKEIKTNRNDNIPDSNDQEIK